MKLILASNSPRRRQLLEGLGLSFEVRTVKGVAETYPHDLPSMDVPLYIAREKAAAYTVGDDEVLLTADTVVIVGNEILGKPRDADEARLMLRKLSGKTHQVVTGVCITTGKQLAALASPQRSFAVETDVTFKQLSEAEIDYYVDHYKPLDKAGAYGIQEWIGYIGCTGIRGSFYNVMGLPVQRVYEELKAFLTL